MSDGSQSDPSNNDQNRSSFDLKLLLERIEKLEEQRSDATLDGEQQDDKNSLTKELETVRSSLSEIKSRLMNSANSSQYNTTGSEATGDKTTALLTKLSINDAKINTIEGAFAVLHRQLNSCTSKLTRLESRQNELEVYVEQSVGRAERTGDHGAITLADLNVRLSALENSFALPTSYDGCIVWKIDNFNRRKQEAEQQRVPSILSPDFFTSPYGYRLRARLYLNGDGIGTGTHLSLYLVIMKGHFDGLLPWPFSQQITFDLLNQDGGKPLRVVVIPEPNSPSFNRPVADRNEASGTPEFCAHSFLYDNPGFLKNDELFIRISVTEEE